jgi:hypothetical protein
VIAAPLACTKTPWVEAQGVLVGTAATHGACAAAWPDDDFSAVRADFAFEPWPEPLPVLRATFFGCAGGGGAEAASERVFSRL